MKPETELEWFPAYPEKWLLSNQVRLMTYEQRGVYWELLNMEWRDGSIPSNLEDLSLLLHLPLDRFEVIWKRVGPLFTEVCAGHLQNEWLETIRAEQLTKHSKASGIASIAANARWEKEKLRKAEEAAKLAGNPPLAVVSGGCSENASSIPEASGKTTNGKASKVHKLKFMFEALPESHRTKELFESLKAYLAYRVEYNRTNWKESTMRDHVATMAALPVPIVIAGLDTSRKKTWQGLFFDGRDSESKQGSGETLAEKRARLKGVA